MTDILQGPRHGCALGALQTVVAIERAIPILHAGPGCGSKLHRGLSRAGGYQGAGYAGADAMPCTNMIEKDVVFGGTDKLHKVIEGALKIMDGDLFVVLTGCTADIIGDDVASVVREFAGQATPIIHVETAGFKGDGYKGHELLLEAIIEQYLQPSDKIESGLVNVFASVPRHDPFWEGDLNELKQLLAGIGLKANILFGHNSGGLTALQSIPAAQFNLVISPYIGLNTAKLLQEKFATPFLHHPVLPVGGIETSKFLRTVAEFAGTSSPQTEEFITRQEAEFYHYIVRASDVLTEYQLNQPKRFYNINDAAYGLAFSKFLVNELGYFPLHQFITEDVPAEYQSAIRSYFQELAPGISSDITFTQDSGVIEEHIHSERHLTTPLLLGTSWEFDIARDINGLHLSVGLPVIDRLILHHTYVGYRGGLNLVEDIYSRLLAKHRE
ncbi:MAG TPA: nitrogenase component 1 [Methylomusa anaerophila]|uniref:Nitrogenase molybdenum-iron protein beta chain n=1 Tax=Methylomusa anaerophila TaxID=1930071 RepID=A0A348AEP9_9FIRM|nr:nitrogenase component 1 [Methylomusa anaerophila]BBB89547.1 nitrogenase molybdenum-iron protein beta chain [Methylomusa anaerophila]HML90085.1 nitrogenase component 1 [Methylomusa anaerophila]